MKLLSEAEFLATFGTKMAPVPLEHSPPLDFWEYFDEIPLEDFAGYECGGGVVENVYRDEAGHFEHVLINSQDRDVFMALMLDLRAGQVVGHRLLNLRVLYGLDSPMPGETER